MKIYDTLVACHDNICGDHFVGHLKTQNALQAWYFWPTMFTNAHTHVGKCDGYQCYTKNNLYIVFPFISWLPLLPFEKWGINYIGPVQPRYSQGMAYIILVVDYLTKCMEIKAMKITDKKTTALFIFENIIIRYEVLRVIASP